MVEGKQYNCGGGGGGKTIEMWWWWWLTLGRNKEKRGEGEEKKSIISLSLCLTPVLLFLQFNIFLTLAGSVEAFINVRIIKRFARVATRENTKFKTQKAKKKLLLWGTMRELIIVDQ